MKRCILCLLLSLLFLFPLPHAEAAASSAFSAAPVSREAPSLPPAQVPSVLLFEKDGVRVELLSGTTVRTQSFSYVIRFTDASGGEPTVDLQNIRLNGRIRAENVRCNWWDSKNSLPGSEGRSEFVEDAIANDWMMQLRLAGEPRLRSLSATLDFFDGQETASYPIEVELPDNMYRGLLAEPYLQAKAEEQFLRDDEGASVRLLALGDMDFKSGGSFGCVLEITNRSSKPISYQIEGVSINGMFFYCYDGSWFLDQGGVRLLYFKISPFDLKEQNISSINRVSVLLSETEHAGIGVPADRHVWYPVKLSLFAPQVTEAELGTILYERDGLTVSLRGKREYHSSEDAYSWEKDPVVEYSWDITVRNDSDRDIELDFVNALLDGKPDPDDPFSDEPHLNGHQYITVGAHCARYEEIKIRLPEGSACPAVSFCASVFTIDRGALLFTDDTRINLP